MLAFKDTTAKETTTTSTQLQKIGNNCGFAAGFI
jgi:hypothetical protein